MFVIALSLLSFYVCYGLSSNYRYKLAEAKLWYSALNGDIYVLSVLLKKDNNNKYLSNTNLLQEEKSLQASAY